MSNKTRQTPGPHLPPLAAYQNDVEGVHIVDETTGNIVAEHVLPEFADVFIAAPDLLEALRTIANQCGPYAEPGKAQLDYATIGNIARAAIAKAERRGT